MIVNYTKNGWEIITQRAHGLLAAQIAMQWNTGVRGERWLETLLAIAEHDDARVELESEDLLTEQGGPVDFTMRRFEALHCQRTIDFALSKSRYIALLCSMHIVFVFEKFKNDDPAVEKFIKEQLKLQHLWRKDLKIGVREAERNYRLLEWCDTVSLLLCQHKEQPEARAIEISKGPDGHRHNLLQAASGELTVTPWPFEHDQFELRFERRVIKQLCFKDAASFQDALRQAEVAEVVCSLRKIH